VAQQENSNKKSKFSWAPVKDWHRWWNNDHEKTRTKSM